MGKNNIILMFAMVLIIIPIATARTYNYLNPSVDDWYTIQPWEIEICRQDGGTQNVASDSSIPGYGSSSSGTTTSNSIYLSQNTITLQARKQDYTITNFTSTLYEVSWYFEPLQNQSDYSVYLVNGESINIGNGTASGINPGAGYYVQYLNHTYTHAKIVYGSNWLQVPISDIT